MGRKSDFFERLGLPCSVPHDLRHKPHPLWAFPGSFSDEDLEEAVGSLWFDFFTGH
jgi:hypothetical protein